MADGLVCMRLADMHKKHPRQDESHVCCKCGQPVGIYPSGQKALEADPALRIECQVCYENIFDDYAAPAAIPREIMQEIRESVTVRPPPAGRRS